MFQLKNEPQSKQNIIAQSISLYRETIAFTFPYSICAAILFFAPQLILAFQSFSLIFVAELVVCSLLGILFSSAMIFRIYCYCYHIPSSFMSTLHHALFKLIPLTLLMIIYSLIILGGTMLLIIPGVILSISLMFSFMLLIIGNQNILQTLIMSHRLVWGQWWFTVMVIGLPILLNVAISLAVFLAVISFAFYYELATFYIYLLIYLCNILLQAFILPFIFNVSLVLLHDLKQRQIS